MSVLEFRVEINEATVIIVVVLSFRRERRVGSSRRHEGEESLRGGEAVD